MWPVSLTAAACAAAAATAAVAPGVHCAARQVFAWQRLIPRLASGPHHVLHGQLQYLALGEAPALTLAAQILRFL